MIIWQDEGGGDLQNLSLVLNSHLHKYAYVWYVSLNFIYYSKILHLLSINSNVYISQSEPKYVDSGPKIYHVFAKYLFKAKARNTYFAKIKLFMSKTWKSIKWFVMFKPKTFKVDPVSIFDL